MNRKEDLINHIKAKIDEKFAKVEITPYQQQRLKCMAEIIELIEKYEESPLTLADFLGWEEGIEYEADGNKFRIKNDSLIILEPNDDYWGDFDYAWGIQNVNWLRQATKVEPKLKAYHVTDEYSFNCLMEELDEQGYMWRSGDKTTDLGAWHNVVIYLDDDKTITHGTKEHYDNNNYKNYDLIEYHKEEPRYYAKIKGWELCSDNYYYWQFYVEEKELFADYKYESELYKTIFTKSEWNKLGINDSNADFERVI